MLLFDNHILIYLLLWLLYFQYFYSIYRCIIIIMRLFLFSFTSLHVKLGSRIFNENDKNDMIKFNMIESVLIENRLRAVLYDIERISQSSFYLINSEYVSCINHINYINFQSTSMIWIYLSWHMGIQTSCVKYYQVFTLKLIESWSFNAVRMEIVAQLFWRVDMISQ